MAETKTFTVQCPDEDCAAYFTVHIPEEDLIEDAETGSPATCPECGQEWDWEYYTVAGTVGTLELLADDEDEDEPEDLEDEFEGAE